jgi:hypothetical protein
VVRGCDALSSLDTPQEARQIISMVLNMRGGGWTRGDMHRAHPQGMRHDQVAGIILEHRGAAGVKPVLGKHGLEGLRIGLGVKIRMLHPVDRMEEAAKPPGGKHLVGIGRAGVGVDDLSTRKRRDGAGEGRVRRKNRKVDVVHLVQVRAGVDVVFPHQPRKRGAVGLPVIGPEVIGAGAVDLQGLHHPVGHPHLDLVKQAHVRRVKRVVEVEDPSGDSGEIGV